MEDISCFRVLTDHIMKDAICLDTHGATSDTFLVRYKGQRCFQKKLKKEFQNNPRYVAAYQKEFQLGKQLDHPHIVKYVDVDDTSIYMEYINGLTLTDFLLDNPKWFQKKSHVNRFLKEMLDALQYMHERQILHLDLKPDNIMMTFIGHSVKIIDLGFCYSDSYDSTAGQTEGYVDPEKTSLDEQNDMYALARVLEFIRNNSEKAAVPNKLISMIYASKNVEDLIEKRKVNYFKYLAVPMVLFMGLMGWFFFHQEPAVPEKLKMAHPGAILPDSASQGVYIVDWEGKLVVPEQWDSTYQALAIALITDSVHSRIALNDAGPLQVWGLDGFSEGLIHTIDSVPHDTPGEAAFDYLGLRNTTEFNRTLGQPKNAAIYTAAHFQFGDGKYGYLPALGEMLDLRTHFEEISHALEVCGGDPMDSYYWTSTQDYTFYRAWSIRPNEPKTVFANLRNEDSPFAKEYGPAKLAVRAFGELK